MKKKTIFIVIGVITVLGLIGAATSSSKQTTTSNPKPQESSVVVEGTVSPAIQTSLTHQSLLEKSKSNSSELLNKTYEMTLYLEQAPTGTQAEFMSQPDDNSTDTILIVCNMQSDDIKRLDGASAQKRDYKPYDLKVTFTNYDAKVGLYYQANCAMK